MTDKNYPPHFAVHAELQDASRLEGLVTLDIPRAASIEIAKILTVFDGQIDDEWRHALVVLGGGLIKLQQELDGSDCNG